MWQGLWVDTHLPQEEAEKALSTYSAGPPLWVGVKSE